MEKLQDIASRSSLSLEDVVKLEEYVLATGYLSHEKTRQQIAWFLTELGFDPYYFKNNSTDDIARHLLAISASELVAQHGGAGLGIQLITEQEDRAVYIVEEESSRTREIENRIEERYPLFRIESYLSRPTESGHRLRLYLLSRPEFQSKGAGEQPAFEQAADGHFLQRSQEDTKERYRTAWEAMNTRETPYVAVSGKEETKETRIMIGISSRRNQNFLTAFSHLFYRYKINSNRKYREVFGDEKKVYSFYFDRIDSAVIDEFIRDLVGVLMLPEHEITELFRQEVYSSHETLYAIAASFFTHQFLSAHTEQYAALSEALQDKPEARGILDNLKLQLVKGVYSMDRISRTVLEHYPLVASIHRHFQARLSPEHHCPEVAESLERELQEGIEKLVPSEHDKTILNFFLTFNNSILKTNFFKRDKRCLAFRLDPAVLPPEEYPERPFGLLFFAGREAIGFHIRFRDIARGGIRIVRSRHHNQYLYNLNTILRENYNLADTQQKKNKDIPEGGAKGTILLHLANQQEEREAFVSYIDSMLDLLLASEEILEESGERDILFLGPDEHTAELMNWAALYARTRGYPYWRSFTTGKAPELGGVPHDLYGMTTRGVHEYVLGVLERLGLEEEEQSKIQTGGPDGDLGSNEILISRDRTCAIVDGSGVLYDPQGLNREELARLARSRSMVEQFDRTLLSAGGFLVRIGDRQVSLPDGSYVPNGEDFRNRFHLHALARADLFVPCGGRPAAININNWRQLLDERGSPKFRIIVEGANLFITEDARLRLEEQGVVVIKDASANKGGVTSSSLEVYASLAMTDEEYERHMGVQGEELPEFRRRYVEQIIDIIRSNARAELGLLWREHERTGIPFTLLTNRVSDRINSITDAVVRSQLPGQKRIREAVIAGYTPPALLELVGLEAVLARVPAAYQEAIVATALATRFVYGHGLSANEVDFYEFVRGVGARRGS